MCAANQEDGVAADANADERLLQRALRIILQRCTQGLRLGYGKRLQSAPELTRCCRLATPGKAVLL